MTTSPAGRIADLVERLDRERFTGRHDVLALVDRVLAGSDTTRVLLVHGPGGIGKSALLREIARRSATSGRNVWTLDGRVDGADLAELEHRLTDAFADPAPVVVLDALEHAPTLEGAMRDVVVPRLGSGAVVVFAGRSRPERAWLADGWEHVARDLELGPLRHADVSTLLAHHGVVDPGRVTDITTWSRGLPLAVTVAATTRADGDALTDLDALILHRLVDTSLDHVDRRVLELAAVTVAVDAPIVAAVLGRRDAEVRLAALRDTSIAESVGSRIALHDMVRGVLRRQLREQAPDRHRSLTTRVADHLRERIVGAESELLVELAELIEDPTLRWGLVGERDRYHVDRVRPGDEDEVAAIVGDRPDWANERRFFRDAPDSVMVARDRAGRIAGFSIAVTPHRTPVWSDEDPLLAPWLADARQRVPTGDVLLWRTECDIESVRDPDSGSTVTAVLNEAVFRTSGLPNPRWFYGVVDRSVTEMVELSTAMGATHLPDLDVTIDGTVFSVHVLDHGPGGFVAAVHRLVYETLGLPTPEPAPATVAEQLDEVLRGFADDAVLAASPLGQGSSRSARASSVRALVHDAVDRTFGHEERDVLLRSVLELGYLQPGASHVLAARSLHLSRATYFRRLREARARLLADLEFGGTGPVPRI